MATNNRRDWIWGSLPQPLSQLTVSECGQDATKGVCTRRRGHNFKGHRNGNWRVQDVTKNSSTIVWAESDSQFEALPISLPLGLAGVVGECTSLACMHEPFCRPGVNFELAKNQDGFSLS